MGQAEPGQLLAELGQHVVGEEAHRAGHHIQDEAEGRLKEGGRGGRETELKVRREGPPENARV